MDLRTLHRLAPCVWEIPRRNGMHVPAVVYASEDLVREMDEKVREQAENVARLPGIVGASYAMPDAHWGYGFPIGGVAAFDAGAGGVVSAGGVGFDISCGVRSPAHRAAARRHPGRAAAAGRRAVPARFRPAWAAPAPSA